jgi:hypothetical protein
LVWPSLVAFDILQNNNKKKKKKSSSTATVQNWTPRRREVSDFLDTSSGHAHAYTKT